MNSYQERIDAWIQAHGGYFPEFVTLARVMEEAGEVAAALQRLRDYRPRKVEVDIEGEVGDLLFITHCLANQLGLDVDQCLEKTLGKIEDRDSKAWKEKHGLQ